LITYITNCLLLVLALLAGSGCQPSTTNSVTTLQQVDPQRLIEHGPILFIADSTIGLPLAKQQEKPCLLFFTAEWCTFCHQIKRALGGLCVSANSAFQQFNKSSTLYSPPWGTIVWE